MILIDSVNTQYINKTTKLIYTFFYRGKKRLGDCSLQDNDRRLLLAVLLKNKDYNIYNLNCVSANELKIVKD